MIGWCGRNQLASQWRKLSTLHVHLKVFGSISAHQSLFQQKPKVLSIWFGVLSLQ